ncbi:MAG: GC-type dockerin domain-anchored protein, partial [Phycisphaerales bacterium]
SGAVYIYNYAGVQLAKIYPDDGLPNQRFGFSVDISQGILAVGAPGQSTNGQEAGAAYIFNTNTNEQLFQLFPNFPAEFDNFGYAIALQDQYAAIGAKYSGPGLGSVDAYVFDTIAGYQIVRLRQGGNAAGSIFGATLDIQDDIVWVTDPRDDQGGSNAGAAYRFNFICTPDLTGDFNLDFFDISAFLNAFTGSDPIADFNGDGLYNFFDISLFLNAFIAGCP